MVVAGAGPAGSAVAHHLARAGRSVLLIERSRYDRPRVGESLAPSVEPLLRDLGVWAAFTALGPVPSYGTRSAWGSLEPVAHTHMTSVAGCGWHVDRRAMDAMLAQNVRAAGAQLITGHTVVHTRHDGRLWRVGLSDGRELEALGLVDATGRAAGVGRRVGGVRQVFDRLLAVSAVVRAATSHQHLLVETAPEGWWYAAPLPDGRMVVMLLTDAGIVRHDGLSRPDRWAIALNRTTHVRSRVTPGPISTRLTVHPATSTRLTRTDDRPWIAVGDAALAVDPVSGSGVVRGLRTAAAAADALDARLDGDAAALHRYERDRDEECTVYLTERAHLYALEQRWDTPFWTRRRMVATDRQRRPRARALSRRPSAV